MKKFLAILILILTFQTPSQANDIRDFQIEGMSIGDSALDYFSEEEIIKYDIDSSEDKKFHRVLLLSSEKYKKENYKAMFVPLEIYDGMHIFINPDDKKYIIHGMEGMLDFENDISNCKIKKKKILNKISKMFKNSKRDDDNGKHPQDKTGKSKTFRNFIKISPSSKYYELELGCYDWAEEMGFVDHFRISIVTDEVNDMYEKIYSN